MNILGIESSCDESAASVMRIIDGNLSVLSNIINSQIEIHKLYGGVVPEIAARAHSENLKSVIKLALSEAKLNLSEIDAFAATSGPGLIGGVMVGMTYAKMLASITKKKFIAINHLEAHALSPKITEKIEYPYLLLMVSGGHSQFVAVKSFRNYQTIGGTIDDSVGEAFDKVAKLLNLGYPGGPLIEKCANMGDERSFKFPLSMTDREGCDMSFSGLKTSVLYSTKKIENLTQEIICNISASFQYTISEILKRRTENALKIFENLNLQNKNKSFVIAGGVAANKYISNKIKELVESLGFQFFKPKMEYCTDNAAMVAYAGIEAYKNNVFSEMSFVPKSRWSLDDLILD